MLDEGALGPEGECRKTGADWEFRPDKRSSQRQKLKSSLARDERKWGTALQDLLAVTTTLEVSSLIPTKCSVQAA